MSDWAVEGEFVFDRHAATDVSVVYAILVSQRRARIGAGQKGRLRHDERGNLRRVSSTRRTKDETIASQGKDRS